MLDSYSQTPSREYFCRLELGLFYAKRLFSCFPPAFSVPVVRSHNLYRLPPSTPVFTTGAALTMPSRSSSYRQPPAPTRHASHRRDFQPPTRTNTAKSVRSKGETRPAGPQRSDTAHSHYVNMLLSQDRIPRFHTIMAAVFVWLLLAGFLVFPGTFTSLRETIEESDDDGKATEAAATVLNTVKNIPLLVIGAVACGISAIGMLWLLITHRRNFVWLLNRLLVPGMANSLAGFISTLIGVYTQQDGLWSITAKVTAIIECVYLVACAGLFGYYTFALSKVKKRHEGFYDENKLSTPDDGKTPQERRKEEAAALEPGGSIV